MSSEKEIDMSFGSELESSRESQKQPKISYTMDFLLSLSELEACKRLPNGFDPSILSEFEDGYHGIQERQRNAGSLPLQSHRRTDYSSSPPTRGDSSNYSRGVYGRWDNRSSVRSDRDSDSQSDKDSDSGRNYSNQSRRSWQSSEHDGLLGSGSFARPPPGYTAGLSGPKGRTNDQYQLKRSNEPYHPPRPYKAGPISRREETLNDETFGSAECTSQDRAEEEKRRRESFELMRKEQHKTLEEKQKSTIDKPKDDHFMNLSDLVEGTNDGKVASQKTSEVESVTLSVSSNESSKSSLQLPVVRPLVPPGFKGSIVDKNCGSASVAPSRALEAGRPDIAENVSHTKAIVQNGTPDDQAHGQLVQKMGLREWQQDNAIIHTPSQKRNETGKDLSSNIEIFNGKLGADNKLYGSKSFCDDFETQCSIGEIVNVESKSLTGHNIIDHSKQDQPSSILDKIFGSVLTDDFTGPSGLMEHRDAEQDGPWTTKVNKSSKFAQWFVEDENKGTEDLSQTKPGDLLSLIVGSERGGPQASDVNSLQSIPSDFPFPSSGITDRQLKSDSTLGLPGKFSKPSKEEAQILTCEDLEQTILSGYGETSLSSQRSLQGPKVYGPDEPKAATDNQASQHLLSLLQKGGVGLNDSAVSSCMDSGSSDKKVESVADSGKPLTLETLFGSAFMMELQSGEAPVSAQRGTASSSAIKSNLNGLSSIDGVQRQPAKSDKIESWFGISNTQVNLDSSKHGSDVRPNLGGFDGGVDIQLPEEDSLFAVTDPVLTRNSMFNPFRNQVEGESHSFSKPLDISDKLAALSTGFREERPMVGREGIPMMRGPHGPMEHEIPFHNLHAHSSSPRYNPTPQMNHGRPSIHPLESHPTHVSAQMNFSPPESMIHHGVPANHQFPANLMRPSFRHPSAGHMLQQMQMPRQTPNNFPHRVQEITRGASLPPHLRTHSSSSMQELNHMQGFPFDQQQPNFGGPGIAIQAAPEAIGNHPEAFQKLLEMELRANSSKRTHPFASLGNNQGLQSQDLDLGFRFR